MTDQPFFDSIKSLFGGSLSQGQVDGLNRYIAEARRRRLHPDLAAYIFATGYHETGGRVQPVREAFAETDEGAIAALDKAFSKGQLSWVSKPYWRPDDEGKAWFGRGDVQLTHRTNYETMGELLNVDLVGNPSLALDPAVSVLVMFEGMLKGLFTGKPLGAYVNPAEGKRDYVNARRVVNKLDRADTIAGYAGRFRAALETIDLMSESRTVAATKQVKKKGALAAVSATLGMIFEGVLGLLGGPETLQEALASAGVVGEYLPFLGRVLIVLAVAALAYQYRHAKAIEEARKDDQAKEGV